MKIAITGPESTGKSTLAKFLSKEYNSTYIREIAREYLEKIERPYSYEDVLEIARLQTLAWEDACISGTSSIIADTELLVIKIWLEHRFGLCPEWIKDKLRAQIFDLYLLCNIDLPWEPDPLREHSDKREYFFQLFKSELEKLGFPYIIIEGQNEERQKLAQTAIARLIS